jgi:type II secretory pathway pseudopilin PulG
VSEAGYTLTETLAAMAVIGMTVGALSLGVQVIGKLQASTSQVVGQLQSTRAAQQTMEQLLARGAPFGSKRPARLSGTERDFRFECGDPAPCSAHIIDDAKQSRVIVARGLASAPATVAALRGPGRFIYGSAKASSDVWPPSAPGEQALRSIVLMQMAREGETPLIAAKIWSEQAAQCAFDPVVQDCQ